MMFVKCNVIIRIVLKEMLLNANLIKKQDIKLEIKTYNFLDGKNTNHCFHLTFYTNYIYFKNDLSI